MGVGRFRGRRLPSADDLRRVRRGSFRTTTFDAPPLHPAAGGHAMVVEGEARGEEQARCER